MTEDQLKNLAKQAFLLFHLREWSHSQTWEQVEPWEREAWIEIARFVATEAISDARRK